MMMFDVDAESKKQDIFDLLLVAGYFRIRIPSISDFDKMLGGISWGILMSGFDIDLDLEYSEEFRIKEKIKLAERVVKGLKNMNCPHPLQPHQIQGLDYGAIQPVIKWLLTFVLETRQLRQDENEAVSSELGRKILEDGKPAVTFEAVSVPLAKPTTKNKKIKKFTHADPIRVYSALAEYGNKKAASTYQKMIIERSQMEGKVKEQKDQPISKAGGPKDIAEELKGASANKLKPAKMADLSGKKKDAEEDVGEVEINQLEGFEERPRLARRNSISAEGFMELLEENKEENERIAEKIKEIEEKAAEGGTLSVLQQENAMFNEQKAALQDNIERAKVKTENFNSVYGEYKEQATKFGTQLESVREINDGLVAALKKINAEIEERQSKMKPTDFEELEQLIEKQLAFKERRNEIKKLAKEEKKRIEGETSKLETRLEEINANQDVVEITEVYEDRRQIYNTKEIELAEVSKEVALLMRKIQEFPNNIEISQYSKRYVDLIDKIAKESENQKKLDMMNNGRVDIERMTNDQSMLLKNIKSNLTDVKKDKQRISLAESLLEVHKSTSQNLERSKGAYKKAQTDNESLLTDLDQQLTHQRDYYQLLQKIQLEYEK